MGAVAAVLVLIVVLSAIHLLPQLRNPSRKPPRSAASPLLTEAQKNTQEMLDGMLTPLGFQHVTHLRRRPIRVAASLAVTARSHS